MKNATEPAIMRDALSVMKHSIRVNGAPAVSALLLFFGVRELLVFLEIPVETAIAQLVNFIIRRAFRDMLLLNEPGYVLGQGSSMIIAWPTAELALGLGVGYLALRRAGKLVDSE